MQRDAVGLQLWERSAAGILQTIFSLSSLQNQFVLLIVAQKAD